MAAIGELLALVSGTGTPARISSTSDAILTGNPEFNGNVSITGNLDVGGDITSRSQVNLVIQDSFLDLGFGNTTATSASGGFTVQMNRTSTFTAGSVTSFDSSSTFTYTDAGTSTLLVAGDIVAITGLPASLSSNEGFFVVASVDQAAFPQVVTIATSPTTSVPFAQTAFVATAFPATVSPAGSAFQCDIAVLAVADGTSAFKNGSGTAFSKGTFVQAYIPDATVSAFQANGAYNVIGGTTLQQAYDSSTSPATILTTTSGGAKNLRFTLASGTEFNVQGASAGVGTVNFGSSGTNRIRGLEVQAGIGNIFLSTSGTTGTFYAQTSTGLMSLTTTTGGIKIDSSSTGVIDIGGTSSTGTGNINIGTYGNRSAINIGHRIVGDVVTTTTIEGVTVNVKASQQGGTGTLNLDARSYGSPANVNMKAISYVGGSQVLIQAGYAGAYTSDIVSIQSLGTAAQINIGSTGSPGITIGNTSVATASVEADTINIGTGAQAHAINIASGTTGAQTINIGTGAANTHTITIGDTSASVTNLLNLEAGQARVTVGGTNAGAQTDNQISVETLATGGTINIGSAAFSHTVNIGTDGTTAQTINIGSASGASVVNVDAGAGGVTIDATGAISIDSTYTTSNFSLSHSGPANCTLTIDAQATYSSAYVGTINIGTSLFRHDINIATGSSPYANTITIGTDTASSFVDVIGGTAVGFRIESQSGAGISVRNDDGVVSLAAGQVVSLASGVTPASTARPSVAKADAATGSTTRRFVGIVQSGGIGTTANGFATSVPGTVAWVAWTANAAGIPAAGDEGVPVYIESSAIDVAGVATKLAPSGSGESVMQIGYLASDTASGGLYAVLLAPQFIAQIP